MAHIVIIGNGITGITTARHVRKLSDHRITVISSESKHFFSRTALMYIYMGQMRYEHTKPYEDWFWEKNRIELIYDHVTQVDIHQKKIHLKNGGELIYDKLVIATGSKPNKSGWPGQDLQGVQGLYSLQDLLLLEENTRHPATKAIIVGGGLIGAELAEMLHSRKIPVTMLVRESRYCNHLLQDQESMLIASHIRQQGIDLRLSAGLKEIIADERGHARAVVTTDGEEIACTFVGLCTGMHPNADFLQDSGIDIRNGVLVNEYLETSIADIYAAGDCARFKSPRPFPVEQLWYTGRMQGEALAQTLCGKRTAYERGIWFNSAKFLKIEYQTYGFTNQHREGEETFYWESADRQKAIRISYDAANKNMTGLTLLGIRFRQAVAEAFIRDKATIELVLQQLKKGLFDPEFQRSFYAELIHAYEEQHPGRRIQPVNSKQLA